MECVYVRCVGCCCSAHDPEKLLEMKLAQERKEKITAENRAVREEAAATMIYEVTEECSSTCCVVGFMHSCVGFIT